MLSINDRILEIMQQKGLSAHALEKKAGLKPSAVHNILYKRSKNPTVNILSALAKALDCTVSELIGESKFRNIDKEISFQNDVEFQDKEWNSILYSKCLDHVSQILIDKKLNLSKKKY